MKPFSVLLLAGNRPGSDPICNVYGVHYKALAPVAGVPMILHPLRTLDQCDYISEILVLAQHPAEFREALSRYAHSHRIRFCHSDDDISSTILNIWQNDKLDTPLLVTTADNCLLSRQHLDNFLELAFAQRSDISMGFLSRDMVEVRYPETGRTWLRFSETELTGCNLFLLKTAQAKQAIHFWKDFESCPKKVLKMAWMLGPLFFWHYLKSNLTTKTSFEKISRLVQASISPVLLDQPDVAIDADKLSDLRQIESIFGYQKIAVDTGTDHSSLRPIIIFDLDRTITDYGTYTPFLVYYALKTSPGRLLSLPIVVALMIGYKLKLIRRDQLKVFMFALLVGSPAITTLNRVCKAYVDRTFKKQVYQDALDTIRGWKDRQATLILATASFDWMANIFAAHLGFDKVVATRSIHVGGHVVPGIDGSNCYGPAKSRMVNEAIGPLTQRRAADQQVWFYTDDHSDIELLEQCSHPVAVNPTRKLRQWALKNTSANIIEWHNHDATGRETVRTRPVSRFKPALMMMSVTVASLFIVTILSISQILWAEDEIPLSNIPAVVTGAVIASLPDITLLHAELDFEHGRPVYELDGIAGGIHYEIEVFSDGTMLEIEKHARLDEQIALKKVPPKVIESAHSALPGIYLLSAEIEYINTLRIYEVEGLARGNLYEIEVAADGRIIDIELESSSSLRLKEGLAAFYWNIQNLFL